MVFKHWEYVYYVSNLFKVKYIPSILLIEKQDKISELLQISILTGSKGGAIKPGKLTNRQGWISVNTTKESSHK